MNEKGIYGKYTVIKNETGKPIDGPAFVLRPDRDPAAVVALTAYAKVTDNKQLAADILRWIKPDEKVVVLPCKVGTLPDNLFSHNSLIALWYDKPDDKGYSHLLWRGMAWDIPEEYKELRLIEIMGIIPESIDKADAINLLVTPYIWSACTRSEAEQALATEATQKEDQANKKARQDEILRAMGL